MSQEKTTNIISVETSAVYGNRERAVSADDALLAKLGYKSELKREFNVCNATLHFSYKQCSK
jgi:hypothetical protein